MESDSEDLPEDLADLIPDWEMYIDPHNEFKWLEAISGKATYQQGSNSAVEQNMEEPDHEMAELAFDLFDRLGRLQSHFKEH
ncbi:hypothetical protein BO70DRAFT_261055, partial [Aspergillus heteromorphus CBS 117.55]